MKNLVFGLCLAIFALVGATYAQDTGPNGTIAAENSAADDRRIADRIDGILAELGGYEEVSVSVTQGIVTLRGVAQSLADAESLTGLATRVEGVVAIKNEVTETTDITERLDPAVDRFQARIEQLITALPMLLIAAALFAAIAFLGRWISRWRRPWDGLAPNRFIANLYRQLVQIAFVIAGLVIALDVLDATALLSTILGAAGIIGLAVGFAVRDTVENYIASIMLSIRQPFRPNDAVEINGDEGKVIRLTSRATILLSFDGNHIRIPNSTVFKSRIVNYSQNAERRFVFTVGVDPAADSELARSLATQTVQDLPFILDEPAALAWINAINEGGIEIKVSGWINQHDTSIVRAKGEALRQVKLAIENAGIELPDTTYRVRLDGSGISLTVDQTPVQTPPAASAPPAPSQAIALVDTSGEVSLDKMIEAERDLEDGEDLLSARVPHE